MFARDEFYLDDPKYVLKGAKENLEKIKQLFTVKILTKVSDDINNSTEAANKTEWLDKWGLTVEVIYVDRKGNKQTYLKPGDFLIDDMHNNLIVSDRQIQFVSPEVDSKVAPINHDMVVLTNWYEVYDYVRGFINK